MMEPDVVVIERTLPERRNDLVFVTNGIPSDFLMLKKRHFVGLDENEITTSVPYFGVLGVGEEPVSNVSSPPTIINNGRHARLLAKMLVSSGINSTVVNSIKHVDEEAVKKLIWISIMWLLCHDCEGDSITCTQVHKEKGVEVDELLHELVPAANDLLRQYDSGSSGKGIGSIADVGQHLKDYSFSMPNVIPNKILAIEEFEQRNGYLLRMEGSTPQIVHRKLVENVVGYIPTPTSPK